MNIPHRKPLEELTIGETMENMTFMLGQVSIMTHSPEAIEYIKKNYEQHFTHLIDKGQYKTAYKYQETWNKITKVKR